MLTVVINAGHHIDFDAGAVNEFYGVREADIAWEVSELTAKYLEAAGVKVLKVFQNNELQGICDEANATNADIFISIHCNSFSRSTAHGTETYALYNSDHGNGLAECVQRQIVDSLGTYDRGVRNTGFYVLKYTKMPAILVELAFISNEDDVQKLMYQKEDFAKAIARGVTDYQIGMLGE